MLHSPSSRRLYVAGAAPGRMSHGSLWSSVLDASFSISLCLSFPSWWPLPIGFLGLPVLLWAGVFPAHQGCLPGAVTLTKGCLSQPR